MFRDRIKQGCGQPNLNTNIVGSTPVLVPPRDEQVAIVDWISRKADEVERLVEMVELAVNNLNEYRSALISAAVTGKIDVRREVAVR